MATGSNGMTRRVAATLLALLSVGCSDVRTLRVDTPDAPADFSIDVTILTGSGAKDLPQAHTRQGKFTILSDGSLHSDYGDSLSFQTRPAITRWLYQGQIDAIWKLAGQEGWLDTSTSNIDVWPGDVRASRNEIVYLIQFHAHSADWWFVRRFQPTQMPDPKAVSLVRAICDLAWSTDRGPDRSLPHRYDFGPDPYVGFTKAPPFAFPKPSVQPSGATP